MPFIAWHIHHFYITFCKHTYSNIYLFEKYRSRNADWAIYGRWTISFFICWWFERVEKCLANMRCDAKHFHESYARQGTHVPRYRGPVPSAQAHTISDRPKSSLSTNAKREVTTSCIINTCMLNPIQWDAVINSAECFPAICINTVRHRTTNNASKMVLVDLVRYFHFLQKRIRARRCDAVLLRCLFGL